MALKLKPTAIAAALAAPVTLGSGLILRNDEYNRPGVIQTVMLEILTSSGTPTLSVQPYQSLDGTNWHAVGSAITQSPSLTALTVQAPYFTVAVTELSGGDLNINIC